MQKPMLLSVPRLPTRAEQTAHEDQGHVQYRSWCRWCSMAKGIGTQHRSRGDQDPKVENPDPFVGIDYGYFGGKAENESEEGPDNLPIIAGKDDRFGVYAGSAVQKKGPDAAAVAYGAGYVKSLGYHRMLMQSDGEPSVVSLKGAIVKSVEAEVVQRESPPGDHKANGLAESAVKDIKKQMRVIYLSIQDHFKRKIGVGHPMIAWLPRHSAALLNRYKVGADGLTAEMRRTGRAWRKPAIQFGERVYFKPAGGPQRGSSAPRLEEGHYVGHHERTGSVMIMTKDGVYYGSTIKRKPEDERWNAQELEELKGYPWDMKVHKRQDGEPRPRLLNLAPAIQRAEEVPGSRARYVTRADIDRYGATDGCRGCTSIATDGVAKVPHSADCRQRIGTAMQTDAVGRARLAADALRRSAPAQEGQDPVGEREPEADGRQLEDAPAQVSEIRQAPPVRERSPKRDSAQIARPDERDSSRRRQEISRGEKRAADMPVEQIDPAVPEHADADVRLPADVTIADPTSGGPAASHAPAQPGDSSSPAAEASAPVLPAEGTGASGSASSSGAWRPMTALDMIDIGSVELATRKVMQAYAHTPVGSRPTAAEAEEIAEEILAINPMSVSEIYSPPRFSALARPLGITPGFSADLEVPKQDGTNWDLSRPEDQKELERIQVEEQPTLLCGSPPCEAFTILRNIGKAKRDPVKEEELVERGRGHLRVSAQAYRRQLDAGRHFLHEAPWSAQSWKEPEIASLVKDPRCYLVKGPMCVWGMRQEDGEGMGFIRKETGWLTSSKHIASVLQRECPNQGSDEKKWHRHIHLIGGRAHHARVYPPKLCRAVLRGLRRQVEEDRGSGFQSLCAIVGGPFPAEPEMPDDVILEGFWDDVNGGWLNEKDVRKARKEELEWMHTREVYRKVDLSECWDVTGKPPVSLRWVDTNKGSDMKPFIRSRMVARELRARTPELTAAELFSAMPPLEALKLLCSLLVSMKVSRHGRPLKLAFFDISRAHLYGKPKRAIYVDLPEEEAEEGKCALLERTMYGTRDASQAWQSDYSELLESHGHKSGTASPALFYSHEADVRSLVHGDDFAVLSDEEGITAMEKQLGERYDYKCTGRLGPDEGDGEECTFLNRVIRYTGPATSPTIEVEADQRHVEVVLESLGLNAANSVSTPAVKQTVQEVEAEQGMPALAPGQATVFRSNLMRIAYIGQDRPDVAETVKCLSRRMVAPNAADFQRLKRLARFLAGCPRLVLVFKPQILQTRLTVEVDSDHAGDLITRRSTTGVVCMFGSHVIRTSSSLQSTVSLSSGESEYYAAVQGAAAGLGVKALLEDWHVPMKVHLVVSTDSTAAKGFASRRGLGRVRHVSTRYLWLQERVARREIIIEKIGTDENRADLLTKCLSAKRRLKLIEAMGMEYRAGRARSQKGTLMRDYATSEVQETSQ